MLNDKRGPIGKALQGIKPSRRELWFIFGQLSESFERCHTPLTSSLLYRLHDPSRYAFRSLTDVQLAVPHRNFHRLSMERSYILRRGLRTQVSILFMRMTWTSSPMSTIYTTELMADSNGSWNVCVKRWNLLQRLEARLPVLRPVTLVHHTFRPSQVAEA